MLGYARWRAPTSADSATRNNSLPSRKNQSLWARMIKILRSSDGDTVQYAALAAVVVDRAMLNQAIVPNRERARLPDETGMQLRVLERTE